MKTTSNHSLSLLKKVFIIIGIILAVLFLFFFIYVSNYYHADSDADAALYSTDCVTVIKASGTIFFLPAGTNTPNLNTGLIFYPGGKVEYTAYAPLMVKLAQHGITCILLKVPFNLAVLNVNAADGLINDFNNGNLAASFALTEASSADGGSGSSIADALNRLQPIKHWYLAGHSLGGVVAAMYLANGHAYEYDGLIMLGAYTNTDLSALNLPVLTIRGENDGLFTQAKYDASLPNLPMNSVLYTIPGGCHAYFGSYGEQKGDGEPSISADAQRSITADVVADWINK